MRLFVLAAIAGVLTLSAPAASAVVLYSDLQHSLRLQPGYDVTTLPRDFDLPTKYRGYSAHTGPAGAKGATIYAYTGAHEGLWVEGFTHMKATFLGFEAGAWNTFRMGLNGPFSRRFTKLTPFGTSSQTYDIGDGLVPFAYSTFKRGQTETITNTGSSTLDGMNIAYSQAIQDVNTVSVVTYFGDDRSDGDHDDLAVKLTFWGTDEPIGTSGIAEVSEPATLGLIGVGLLGLAALVAASNGCRVVRLKRF